MKPLRIISLFVCLSAVVVYFSCQKSGINGGGRKPPEMVSAAINGRVLDENKAPLQGVLVKAGSSSATTDLNGEFSISNASLDKNAGYIKAEKDGYFLGSRTITVSENVVNHISIQLIKKIIAGNFNAGAGGSVNVPSGGSINFQAAAVVNAETKTGYTGVVNVSAFFINPSASNFRDIMPGALRGITQNDQERGLQSFGMLAVELNGAAGEKLQLGNGKTATLTFPIPNALQSSAPATIPLWSFDETTGLWKEEGSATKQGNNYVGTVSHFSFWNCDKPFDAADFSVTVKDQNGNPLPKYKVLLRQQTTFSDSISAQEGYGITDANGYTGGKIPANTKLDLFIYNKCGQEVYTKEVGPFSGKAELGTVTINTPASQSLAITGTVVNCTANPVTNGFVDISLEGVTYRTAVQNGNFSIQLSRCGTAATTLKVLPIDAGAGQQGTAKEISVTTGVVDAGQLSACGITTNEFVNYSINSANYGIMPPSDTLYGNRYDNTTSIAAYSTAQNDYRAIYLGFRGNAAPGTVALDYVNVSGGSSNFVKNGTLNVNITEYGQVGEYIAGNFTGTLKDTVNASITAPVTLSFRVKRKE